MKLRLFTDAVVAGNVIPSRITTAELEQYERRLSARLKRHTDEEDAYDVVCKELRRRGLSPSYEKPIRCEDV